MRLYVGNLSYNTAEAELETLFATIGQGRRGVGGPACRSESNASHGEEPPVFASWQPSAGSLDPTTGCNGQHDVLGQMNVRRPTVPSEEPNLDAKGESRPVG